MQVSPQVRVHLWLCVQYGSQTSQLVCRSGSGNFQACGSYYKNKWLQISFLKGGKWALTIFSGADAALSSRKEMPHFHKRVGNFPEKLICAESNLTLLLAVFVDLYLKFYAYNMYYYKSELKLLDLIMSIKTKGSVQYKTLLWNDKSEL